MRPAYANRRQRQAQQMQQTGWRAHAVTQALLRHRWFLVAAAPFALFWTAEYARYLTLPDPLFGGDSWQQFGIVMHVWAGNAPWTDAAFAGEYAFRDWLMYVLIAGIAKVTTIDPLRVALFWPLAVLLGGGAVAYAIGQRMFASTPMAVALSIAWMGVSPFMAFQSSAFAAMLTVPLFVLALMTQDGSLKRRLVLGLAFGAASLSYLVAFFGCSLMLAAVLAWRVAKGELRALPSRLAAQARWAAPVALVAAPIVLALWGPVLYVYGGNVQNPSHLYCDSCLGWNGGQALAFLRDHFLGVGGPLQTLFALVSVFGLYAAAKQWSSHGGKWAYLVLAVGLVGTYHYLLTMPLLGQHLVFFRWPKVFLVLSKALFVAHAIFFVARDTHRDELRPAAMAIALSALVFASAVLVPQARSSYADNSKVDDERTRTMLGTAEWIVENTPDDAVFLALDQESFALNGLTGKDVLVTRRSHANTFVDMDQRIADAAVMIYGKDRAFARELMDQYGVTHAYMGWWFEENQASLPLLTDVRYESYWRENGIRFDIDMAPYDPSGANVQFFRTVIVNETGDQPPMLQDFRLVKQADFEGKPWIRVYERID